MSAIAAGATAFLSIQAQDFIEETPAKIPMPNSNSNS